MNEPDQILPWQNLGSNEPMRGARRFGLPGVLPLGHPRGPLPTRKGLPKSGVSTQGKSEPPENILFLGTQAPLRSTSEVRCSDSRSESAPQAHGHSVHLFRCFLSTHTLHQAQGTQETTIEPLPQRGLTPSRGERSVLIRGQRAKCWGAGNRRRRIKEGCLEVVSSKGRQMGSGGRGIPHPGFIEPFLPL